MDKDWGNIIIAVIVIALMIAMVRNPDAVEGAMGAFAGGIK